LGLGFSWSQPFRRHSVDRRASCGPTVCCRAQRRGGHCWCVVRSPGGLLRPYLEARISLSLVEVYSSPCSPCEAEDGPSSPRTVTRVLSEGSRQASISPVQVSRARGGRYACRQSGIFLCVEPSLLEHNGAIVTCCFSQRYRFQAVVKRSNSKSTIEFP